MARRYGRRPSELVEISDPVVALDFDIAIALKSLLHKPEGQQEDLPAGRHGECTDFTPIIR